MYVSASGVRTLYAPPEGYVPDYDNPQRQYVATTYGVWSVGILLALLFVAQRLYVNIAIRKKFGLGDVFIILGLAFNIASQGIVLYQVVYSLIGVHIYELPIDHYKQYAFLSRYVNAITYAFPSFFCKLSILMFFLNLNTVSNYWRWSIYFTIFVVAGSCLSQIFYSAFPCTPIRAAYDPDVIPERCIDQVSAFKATCILGVITDVMIISLPVPMVTKLQISTRKKIGLLALFFVGSVTVITSIVRLILLITALSETDETWGAIFIDLWVVIEGDLLVICACLSTLKLFLNTVAPGLMSSRSGTGANQPPYSDLQTFGGSGPKSLTKRQRLHSGKDTSVGHGYPLTTFDVHIEGGIGERNIEGRNRSEAGVDWAEDSGSERAIIQKTTETLVSYS